MIKKILIVVAALLILVIVGFCIWLKYTRDHELDNYDKEFISSEGGACGQVEWVTRMCDKDLRCDYTLDTSTPSRFEAIGGRFGTCVKE